MQQAELRIAALVWEVLERSVAAMQN